METVQKVLSGLIVFNLEVSLWSGQKKLKPEDLKGAILPPDTLASLGCKRVYNPDALSIFATYKRQAERACLEVGTRFLGGYAVPEDKSAELWGTLVCIQNNFENAKSVFMSEYDNQLNNWLDQADEWRDIVAAAVEPAGYVSGKLNFGFTAYKVDMPESFEGAGVVMENQVNGLAGQLIREIGKLAKDTWEESYRGKTEVTRKALSQLKVIRDKLSGLSFIAPEKIVGLVTNVESALNAVPKSGPITGSVLMGIVGVLAELSDIAGFVSAKEKAAMAHSIVKPEEKPAEEPKTVKTKSKPAQKSALKEPKGTKIVPMIQLPEIEVIPEPVHEVDQWIW